MGVSRYRLRLMFEWGGGCIWGGNDEARDRFGVGPLEHLLPLSDAIRARLSAMSSLHDTALDWADPTAQTPWSEQQVTELAVAASSLRDDLQSELGPDYEIEFVPLVA